MSRRLGEKDPSNLHNRRPPLPLVSFLSQSYLRSGVPEGETPVTCTAGVGTYIIEFGALSRLTGNPVYEETALRALRALWRNQSALGLPGNHIDVLTGKWTAVEAGIGAGVDSYYEYLVKVPYLIFFL
jgi:mannosidase alpha-like ER degradation enhancer 2